MKLMTMTQTSAKYPKYDDNIYWKEQNQQKQNTFWKTTQNKPLQQEKSRV
jgi:hypothetical protein